MPSVKSALVTGSAGLIGSEMVRQLAAGKTALGQPRYIFACHRASDDVRELKKIAERAPNGIKIHLICFDITDDKEIAKAVQIVESVIGQDGLTLLINCAAAIERGSLLPSVDRSYLIRHMDVNVISPLLMAQAFLPLLRRSAEKHSAEKVSTFRAAVVNISSGAGSVSTYPAEELRDLVGYRMSKAALNMATKCLAMDLKDSNVLFLALCPGWVEAGASGVPSGPSSPQQAVPQLFNTLAQFGREHDGRFFGKDGSPMPY